MNRACGSDYVEVSGGGDMSSQRRLGWSGQDEGVDRACGEELVGRSGEGHVSLGRRLGGWEWKEWVEFALEVRYQGIERRGRAWR